MSGGPGDGRFFFSLRRQRHGLGPEGADCGCPAGPPEIEQPGGTSVASKDDAVVTCGNWTSTSGICITQPK
ncbi:MAG: hypothetical protein IPM35_09440 [Myxococcales bacterium]|nr:hypothetical protein [Myxococcales bacterium]